MNAGLLWFSDRIKPLRDAIQKTGASVVIAFGLQANILTILASRDLGHKLVISERNDVAYRRLGYPWEELRCGLYNRADIITANTLGALETMQGYVDRKKLAFVPNPIVRDENGANASRLSSFEAPFVLIVGNLDRLKAHDVLLEAFARLSPELSNWRLAIVGGGDEEKTLGEQVRALGIADRVDWYGRVANPFVFYHAATIFALPSRSEGMPNALMEAMSCGLPVIVSNASPGPLDLVKDGETGLVVPVGDPSALAKAIELLASNAGLRKGLADAARKRVSEYELSKVMPIWERITDAKANLQGVASTSAPHLFSIS
jgi:glycosyltransferase involved in cell wall biosynthesis